jgi:hypothetical protein
MKLNQACRLLVTRVEELTAEAERVKESLILLLMDPAALTPGEKIQEAFGEAAVSVGDSLQDVTSRIRRLNEIINELQALSPSAQMSSGL